MPEAEQVKEIEMPQSMEGGGTRKRKYRKRRKATMSSKYGKSDNSYTSAITKESYPSPSPSPFPSSFPSSSSSALPLPPPPPPPPIPQTPPKIIIAPAKKKPAKVLLVPKGTTNTHTHTNQSQKRSKTFKSKRVRVVIDNSAKTLKRRRSVMASVDAMTDDHIRAVAVKANLSRKETVGKTPISLLRGIIKEYQSIKQ